MPEPTSKPVDSTRPAQAEPPSAPVPAAAPDAEQSRPRPDPTRYGDWEKNGRCIDF
ncbi:MAG TPA: DUF1674 domain-containing protein [Mizugakiibacter sp.]